MRVKLIGTLNRLVDIINVLDELLYRSVFAGTRLAEKRSLAWSMDINMDQY
jgi:hypothetical protein